VVIAEREETSLGHEGRGAPGEELLTLRRDQYTIGPPDTPRASRASVGYPPPWGPFLGAAKGVRGGYGSDRRNWRVVDSA
jgi:hypothetical protein